MRLILPTPGASTARLSPAIIALALLSCFIGAMAMTAEQDAHSYSEAERLAVSKDSAIKDRVLEFNQFKALFHKSYKSIAEETRRQTLYLANLIQMFTSHLSFRLFRSSSFRSVNQMSDWTEEEFQDTLMDAETYLKDAMRASELDPGGDYESEIQEIYDDDDDDEEEEEDDDDDDDDEERAVKSTLGERLSENAEDQSKIRGRLERLDSFRENINESGERFEEDADDRDTVGDCDENSGNSCPLEIMEQKNTLGGRIRKLGTRVGKSLSAGAVKSISAVDKFVQGTYLKARRRKPEYRPDLPDEVFVDHRDSGCLTTVKNQKQCGSCYIFSTVALYEWAYCKREGERVHFSEQYLLDCGHKSNMRGCRGGFESDVGRFIGKYGLELSERYEYQANEGECPYEPAKVPRQSMGFVRMDRPELSLLSVNSLEEQLETSPVLVVIYTADKFSQYGGGIDEGKGCGKHRFKLHAVLIVGHGRQDGHEYWIMRNSHGFWFGEFGYYKVRKDSKCLARYGTGHTLKALRRTRKDRAPKSKSKRMMSGQTDDYQEEKDSDEYKFFENPKNDWKILAEKFQMTSQSPPTLPKRMPIDTKLPFWPV